MRKLKKNLVAEDKSHPVIILFVGHIKCSTESKILFVTDEQRIR